VTTKVDAAPVRARSWAGVRALDWRVHLAAATTVGLVLRCWQLAQVPPGLNQDEAVYGYDAYSISMTGRDHLGHPFPFAGLETFGDWSSPLLTFLSVPVVALFGLHVEALRGLTAVIGVAGVPLVYLLATRLTGRRIAGLSAAWVLAVLPWSVHLSRWAIIPSIVPTMVAATILVAVWALETRNARGLVLASILAGFTAVSYHAMKVYVPLLILLAAAVYWRELWRLRWEPLVYAGLVFGVLAGPSLYLTLRDPGGGARLAQTSVLNDSSFSLALMARQYGSYFSPSFWFTSGDGDPMHLPPGQGLFPLAAAPLLLIGLGALAWMALRSGDRAARYGARFLLGALALYPIPGSLTVPSPHVLRAAHVLPLAVVVAAVGVVTLVDLASRSSRSGLRLTPVAAGLAILALAAFGTLELSRAHRDYFGNYRDTVAEPFHTGVREAIAYVDGSEADIEAIWLPGDMNSVYIYVLFYLRWNPEDVHRSLVVRRDPPNWNYVESIGRYHFGEPPEFEPGEVLFTSRLPDGTPAYEVLSGSVGAQHVLVLRQAVLAGQVGE
jgi:4-amino-4-deoxy-L-arabinose transferase-like glycosyltransferase